MLVGVGQSPELLHRLRQRELPTVHTMVHPPPPGLVCVGFDNARAMGQAVRYLLDLGHRRIAKLAGLSSHNDRAAARIEGVSAALKTARLSLPPQHLVECPYGLAEAAAAPGPCPRASTAAD